MDGLFANHPAHNAITAENADALANEYLTVPAANGLEVTKAFVVDMRNHQADFVDMSCQQYPGRTAVNNGV